MGIAREYLKTIDYADVTPALVGTTEEWWIDGARSIFYSYIKEKTLNCICLMIIVWNATYQNER